MSTTHNEELATDTVSEVKEPVSPSVESQPVDETAAVVENTTTDNNLQPTEGPPEEEVTPHPISPDSLPTSAIVDGHIPDNTYDESEPELKIDLSTIEFDKHGVPVLTAADKAKIQQSGFASDSFAIEIQSAAASIKRCIQELDEEQQHKDEILYQEKIVELQHELKQYQETHKINEETQKEIDSKNDEIKMFKELIDALPINNPEQKKLLEEEKASSIDLIATYQHISRKTIDDLVKDGSLLALVSNATTTSFVSSYIEEYNKRNDINLETDELLTELNTKLEEYSKHRAEPDITYLQGLYAVRDECIVYADFKTGEEDEEGEPKYEQRRDMSDITLEQKKAFDAICSVVTRLSFAHPLDSPEFEPDLAKQIKLYEDVVETHNEKMSEIENAIATQKGNLTSHIKQNMIKNGLYTSLIQYALYAESSRSEYGRNINFLNYQYVDIVVDHFYRLIKDLTGKNIDAEFAVVKQNVNNISMNQNNLIHYIEMLHDNTLDVEWAENFDPQSQLKQFYFENEEMFKTLIDNYREQKKILFKIIKGYPTFLKQAEIMINHCVTYITDFNKKAKSNIKIKDKYFKYLTVGFYDQILHGFQTFVKASDALAQEHSIGTNEKTPEEEDKYLDDAIRPLYSTLLHNILGFNIIASFMHFKEYFKQHYNNAYLASDCVKYLFHEFSLSLIMFKNLKKEQVPIDYIKTVLKDTSFQSTTFDLEKNIDINESRKTMFNVLFTSVTAILNDINSAYISFQDDTDNNRNSIQQTESEKHTKKKHHTVSKEKLMAGKKKKKKQAKAENEIRESINMLKHWHNNISANISDTALYKNSKIVLHSVCNEGIFAYQLIDCSTTSCRIRVNLFKDVGNNCKTYDVYENLINYSDVKGHHFKDAARGKTAEKLLNETLNRSFFLSSDHYRRLNMKLYYNVLQDTADAYFECEKLEQSEEYYLEYVVKNLFGFLPTVTKKPPIEKLVQAIIFQISPTVASVTDKNVNIKFKENGKIYLSKYDESLDKNIENDILNFYNTVDKVWRSFIIELKYDIVFEEKPVEKIDTEVNTTIEIPKENIRQVNVKFIPEINPKTGKPYSPKELKEKNMMDMKRGISDYKPRTDKELVIKNLSPQKIINRK